MSDYAPVYENGSLPYTMTASAAVTGGQVLVVSGVGTVAPAAGSSGVVAGVAAHDAAINGRVSIWPIPGLVHETLISSTITAADSLTSATTGQVITGVLGTLAAAGTLLGTALNSSTTGLKVRWLGK